MESETNETSFPPVLRVFSSGEIEKEDLIFCLKFKVFINYIFILKCGKIRPFYNVNSTVKCFVNSVEVQKQLEHMKLLHCPARHFVFCT